MTLRKSFRSSRTQNDVIFRWDDQKHVCCSQARTLGTTISSSELNPAADGEDHIRPVLKKLHWLPIENRIVFKILLLTFKARAKLAPQYIQDLINDYTPQRNLRSGSKCLLETPNYNLESYGKRAFSVAHACGTLFQWN